MRVRRKRQNSEGAVAGAVRGAVNFFGHFARIDVLQVVPCVFGKC